ncbi:hypothetical protein BGZ61DRAFT_461655 [Ilyonectria robusta]|uniref:uncharacterized protein n=1 Tax=Ilyonectria robusta TaxID=1079257 RepID=UPI001E8DE3BE|nr:uncharacterized protein BGZ61DRAFT_461655 [Ilyonectria robusta]KAH8666142.1 hypothetical protein BGZ61DRAFT_461655 [Ilyonectria robusta]
MPPVSQHLRMLKLPKNPRPRRRLLWRRNLIHLRLLQTHPNRQQRSSHQHALHQKLCNRQMLHQLNRFQQQSLPLQRPHRNLKKHRRKSL